MNARQNRSIHEYLQSFESGRYKECTFCHQRKTMVCLKCGYCFTCHPVVEQLEKRPAAASA